MVVCRSTNNTNRPAHRYVRCEIARAEERNISILLGSQAGFTFSPTGKAGTKNVEFYAEQATMSVLRSLRRAIILLYRTTKRCSRSRPGKVLRLNREPFCGLQSRWARSDVESRRNFVQSRELTPLWTAVVAASVPCC